MLEQHQAVAVVLPWLWPLADEDSGCNVQVTPAWQQRILAALAAVSDGSDTVLQGKVSRNLLHALLMSFA